MLHACAAVRHRSRSAVSLSEALSGRQGLPALLAEDPVAQGPVLEMLLLPHFRQLLEPDVALHPPIKLERCAAIPQVRIQGPAPVCLAGDQSCRLCITWSCSACSLPCQQEHSVRCMGGEYVLRQRAALACSFMPCSCTQGTEEVRVVEPLPDLIACVRDVVGLTQSRASAAAEPGSPAGACRAATDGECTRVSCRGLGLGIITLILPGVHLHSEDHRTDNKNQHTAGSSALFSVGHPQELQRAYRSMVDRVCTSSLEHWGLDSIDELSASSAQARMWAARC